MLQDRNVFFAVLAVGILVSVFYCIKIWLRGHGHPQFLNVAKIFGSALGLVSGIKLCCLICLDDPGIKVGNDDKLAIFVGGLAICWVSILAIGETFKYDHR